MDGWLKLAHPAARAHYFVAGRASSLCGKRHITKMVNAGAARVYTPAGGERCAACQDALVRRLGRSA